MSTALFFAYIDRLILENQLIYIGRAIIVNAHNFVLSSMFGNDLVYAKIYKIFHAKL